MSEPSSPKYNFKLGKNDKEESKSKFTYDNSDSEQEGEVRLNVRRNKQNLSVNVDNGSEEQDNQRKSLENSFDDEDEQYEVKDKNKKEIKIKDRKEPKESNKSKEKKKRSKKIEEDSEDDESNNKYKNRVDKKKKKEVDLGSTYSRVDKEDIINLPSSEKAQDPQENPTENPQKGSGIGKANVVVSKFHGWKGDEESYYVYVEDGLKGRFKKMQYSQFLKILKEKEESQEKNPQTETIDNLDKITRLKFEYRSLYFQLAALILNIFAFCRGLLAGVCLLHLTLTYFSNYNSFISHFLQWYSPISSLVLKIYMILTQLCFACSIFELLFKVSKPPSVDTVKISPPITIALILQLVLYLIVFYLTLIISSLDDYFQQQYSSNNQWFQNTALQTTGPFLSKFILWHVVNGIRTVLCMIGYIISFIAYRQRSGSLQYQMLRRQDLRHSPSR